MNRLQKVAVTLSIAATATIVFVGLGESGKSQEKYIIRPGGGIEAARAGQFGIPHPDAAFLAALRGPVVGQATGDGRAVKASIRNTISRGYEKTGRRLLSKRCRFASDRERFIVYTMLRVNGSFSTYGASMTVSNNMSTLLAGKVGNCGVDATRLMMVLDAFGIRSMAIVWYSPSLYGHIFVCAYDPVEHKGYLLDPTFNIWAEMDHANPDWLDSLARRPPEQRWVFLRHHLKQFPFYFVSVEGLSQAPDAFREDQALSIKDQELAALTYEWTQAMRYWKDHYPSGSPYSLESLAGMKDVQMFHPQYSMSPKGLLDMAGIRKGAR